MNDFKDEHSGKGGSYVIENGKRVLQERTGYVAPPVPPVRQGHPAQTIQTIQPVKQRSK